jgi:hypothetical protein
MFGFTIENSYALVDKQAYTLRSCNATFWQAWLYVVLASCRTIHAEQYMQNDV